MLDQTLEEWLVELEILDAPDIANAFRDQKFNTIEDVESMSMAELQESLQGFSHATIRLIDRARKNRRGKQDVHLWDKNMVITWLENSNCQSWIEGFHQNEITGRNLLLLKRSDLGELRPNERIPVKETSTLYNALQNLKQIANDMPVFMSQQERVDFEAEHEIVQIGFNEPYAVELNYSVYEQGLQSASRIKYSPVISFVGPTGEGKSFILNEFLTLTDRLNKRGPILAVPGQQEPNSCNVHLFKGSLNKMPINLLDIEGEGGRIPKLLENEFRSYIAKLKMHLKSAVEKVLTPTDPDRTTDSDKIKSDIIAARQAAVDRYFPQLAYCMSDIIIFVDRQPLHQTTYIKRVCEYAAKTTREIGSSDKPSLIIIRNFVSPATEESEYDDYDPFSIEDCTIAFYNSLSIDERQNLSQAFSIIKVAKVPNAKEYPDKYDEQIRRIKATVQFLLGEAQSLRTRYTMNPENFFPEYMWYLVLHEVRARMHPRSPNLIDMSEVISLVCQPQEDLLIQMHNLWNLIYDGQGKPELPRAPFWNDKSNVLISYQQKRMHHFMHCRHDLIKQYALTLVQPLRNLGIVSSDDLRGRFENEQHITGNVQVMLYENLNGLFKVIDGRKPCCFHYETGEICVLDQQAHNAGHRFIGPRIREFANLLSDGQTRSAFLVWPQDDSRDHLQTLFLFHLARYMKLNERELLEKKCEYVETLNSKMRSVPTNYCLFCMQNYNSVMLGCGHKFCHSCTPLLATLASEGQVKCPLCAKAVSAIENIVHVGPRILSIDGGGVRGVATLAMLSEMERLTSLQVKDLFDMIAGTSSGGIQAISLGLTGKSVDETLKLYHDLSKTIFTKGNLQRLVEKATFKYLRIPYDIDVLVAHLRENLPNETLLDKIKDQSCLKVMVVASDDTNNKFVMFTNYVTSFNYASTTQQYVVDNTSPLWVAAAATSAAPTYFYPLEYNGVEYSDGGLLENNPAELAVAECKFLWKSEPSIVISLGTGTKPQAIGSKKRYVDLLKRMVELVADVNLTAARVQSLGYAHRFSPIDAGIFGLDEFERIPELIKFTKDYLDTPEIAAKFRAACSDLVAKLFYVSNLTHFQLSVPTGDSITISINERVKNSISILSESPLFKYPVHLLINVAWNNSGQWVDVSSHFKKFESSITNTIRFDGILKESGHYQVKIFLCTKKERYLIAGCPFRIFASSTSVKLPTAPQPDDHSFFRFVRAPQDCIGSVLEVIKPYKPIPHPNNKKDEIEREEREIASKRAESVKQFLRKLHLYCSRDFDWKDRLSMEGAISTLLMGQAGEQASKFVRSQALDWLGKPNNFTKAKDILSKPENKGSKAKDLEGRKANLTQFIKDRQSQRGLTGEIEEDVAQAFSQIFTLDALKQDLIELNEAQEFVESLEYRKYKSNMEKPDTLADAMLLVAIAYYWKTQIWVLAPKKEGVHVTTIIPEERRKGGPWILGYVPPGHYAPIKMSMEGDSLQEEVDEFVLLI